MSSNFFERHLDAVKSKLSIGETVDDIETMFSIIVEARRQNRFLHEEDERIALWSLCFLGLPMKAERYQYEIGKFRRRFVGIFVQNSLQQQFKKTIKVPLLQASKIEELKADKLSDLFYSDN